jgi:hypothetical protein
MYQYCATDRVVCSQSTFVLPYAAQNNVVALYMGDRWNPDSKVAPGGEHNSTFVWLNVVTNADPALPPLTMQWQPEFVPGKP